MNTAPAAANLSK